MTKFYASILSLVATQPKREERGATAVEYGLLVALIAAVIVGIVVVLGSEVREGFATVVTNLGGTDPNPPAGS